MDAIVFTFFFLIMFLDLYINNNSNLKGKVLSNNPTQPPFFTSVLEWFFAGVVASMLFPLHYAAKKLVYSAFHSSIGISKVYAYILNKDFVNLIFNYLKRLSKVQEYTSDQINV